MKNKYYVWLGNALTGPWEQRETAMDEATRAIQDHRTINAVVLHCVATVKPKVEVDE